MSAPPAPRARPRRTVLLLPATSPRLLRAAAGSADEVVVDLEDTVLEDRRDDARRAAVEALTTVDWGDTTVAVRVNAVATRHAYRDVLDVVAGAGEVVDCLVVPKVQAPGEVEFVDQLLRMLEEEHDLEHTIGLEAQIANPPGLALLDEIAFASDRLEALVTAPVDMAASLGGDAGAWVRQRVLVTARAAGLQAVDGPFPRVKDRDGFRAAARQAQGLGYDGSWVLNPQQADIAREVFTPTSAQLAAAEDRLAAYDRLSARERAGSVLVDDEVVDAAGRRLAEVTALRARAAGVVPRR